MKKLTLSRTDSLTFGEGCEKYLDNCRQRNLRKGTINHYRQSYTQFFKYFDPDMPVADKKQLRCCFGQQALKSLSNCTPSR